MSPPLKASTFAFIESCDIPGGAADAGDGSESQDRVLLRPALAFLHKGVLHLRQRPRRPGLADLLRTLLQDPGIELPPL